MDDLISRAAAIDAIKAASKEIQHWLWEAEGCEGYCAMVADVETCLDDLPSVQPERKRGKWNFIGDQMFECTECGVCYTQNQFHQMRVRITDPEFPNYCPNCGADMRGEQDEGFNQQTGGD